MRALIALLCLTISSIASAANAYITEFRERPPVTYQAAIMPALANQNLSFTTSSVQSAAFQDTTQLVRVHCSAACYVLFGASPTATLSSMRLEAGETEYFTVVQYSGLKLAVIGQ